MRVSVTGLLALSLAPLLAAQERAPVRTALIDGQVLRYQVIDDMAVAEGDILLGPAAEIEAAASGKSLPRGASVYLNSLGNPANWPAATMYYEFAPGFPNQQRVLDAIEHWNSRTPLKVLPRTGQPNYVRFTTGSGCSSFLGMLGGAQSIPLASACSTAAVVHEIGHAFGLMHEQARLDRDQWLTVLYGNIDSVNFSQYHQRALSRDQGYYDYGSIMHYAPAGFSLDGNKAVETVPPGIPIGQRNGLSAGDIDGVTRLYGFTPDQTTITTIPEGLTIVVDGTVYSAPQSFAWAPGTVHTLSVEEQQETGPQAARTRNVFVRWSNGGASTRSFTASAEETVVAAIFQERFPVTATVSSGVGAVVVEPPTPDGYYLAGTKVRVRALPAEGQALYTWSGNDPEFFGLGLSAETLEVEVRQPLTFRAHFRAAASLTTLDAPPDTLVRVDGVPYFTPVRFQWAPGSTYTLSVTSTQLNYSETIRYRFAGWEDGSLSPSRTIQVQPGAQTYRANFDREHYLNYSWAGSGSVSVSPGGSAYIPEGTVVTLTGTPLGSQSLQYWLGDRIGGRELAQSFVMDGPRYAYAVFGPALNFRTTHAGSYASNVNFDEPGTFVAPLELVALFGTQLGPGGLTMGGLDALGRLSSTVANTRVLFDGIPAPIVYASNGQTVVVVPATVAGRVFTVITVERDGVVTGITTASVAPSLPGIFTADASGSGQIAMINHADNSLNTAAPAGGIITFYASGAGLMDRAIPDGAVMDLSLARPQLPVWARIGDQDAEVLYAGSAPTLVNGVLQVSVRIPSDLAPGTYAVRLIVGQAASAPGPVLTVR